MIKGVNFIKPFSAVLLLLLTLSACKKDTPSSPLVNPSKSAGKEELLKDSVFLYTSYFYLWQDQLPGSNSFNPRSFKTAEEVLNALKGYAKDPQGRLLDRFSFLDRSGQVNASIQEGLSGSFGLDVRYNNENDLFVKLVYPGSPAARAGIERGWQLMEINGNSKLDQASFEADNFEFLTKALDQAQQIDLKLKLPDGRLETHHLTREQFRIQPILHQQIFPAGGKRVGYFVFDTFVSTETASNQATYVKSELDKLFAEFESAGVSQVIMDLRYNGGGAVITAEYLSDLLAPQAADKQLMYSYQFNETLQEDGWDAFFTPVHFNKTNSLNLEKIYFLVTQGSTASASELLINNLSPFITTYLIGEIGTYGKPVGFFPWEIEKVDLYAVSFKTTNNQGYGDYFFGMPVDKSARDDVSKNWGDPAEAMLRQALHHAENNTFLPEVSLQAGRTAVPLPAASAQLNRELDKKGNHDMFRFRSPAAKPLRLK